MSEQFRDWVPTRVSWKDSTPSVEWCYMGNERFTDPFFEDTIRRLMRVPFNLLFRRETSIEILGEVSEQSEVVAPTGFIFHMSRCGSTLIAQMLAALRRNIVISEAPPVDSIISSNASDCDRGRWLAWMIGTLGRQRNEGERNYFLKLDSWNILELDLIRRTFPAVPWIFLYRNPVEVIASHMRQRGLQMVPGGPMTSLLTDVNLTQALEMRAEEYCARVLARFCAFALQNARDQNAMLINYDQLPGAVTKEIAKHFRLSFTDAELAQMNDAAKLDAKTPKLFFEPDSERKRTEASDAARRAAAEWVEPIYEQLENIRISFSK
ncbi:MAG TPA: hypothetical protein VMZ26_08610 [Pyrinomonadaceae bacterium]|nr:hypothetical protein [Pyrinomonadaceae bacterium]